MAIDEARKSSFSITYFDSEGRDNLAAVLKTVKKVYTKRPDLRGCKLVFLTAFGEGPALAYNLLSQWDPKIIAVTFGPNFRVKTNEGHFTPHIPEKVRRFFEGVGIKVIHSRLPFDDIDQSNGHNSDSAVIRGVLSIFNGSMVQAVQAILQSCDTGDVLIGERVIAATGDCAIIARASSSSKFMSYSEGMTVEEILCKPRRMTVCRLSTEAGLLAEQLTLETRVTPEKC